eukprot:scpid80590/ scgid20676/ 
MPVSANVILRSWDVPHVPKRHYRLGSLIGTLARPLAAARRSLSKGNSDCAGDVSGKDRKRSISTMSETRGMEKTPSTSTNSRMPAPGQVLIMVSNVKGDVIMFMVAHKRL